MGAALVTHEVVLMREMAGLANLLLSKSYQITAGYDARTGQKLWGPLNQSLPEFHAIQVPPGSFGGIGDMGGAGDGVYTMLDKDTMQIWGYSLTNGKKIWGPVKLPGNAMSHLDVGSQVGYGNVYVWDFGGYVHALDLQTGDLLWTLTPRSTGYDTPYGTSPIWSYAGSICDGILFLGEGSLYNPPVHANARMLAINCTTGELVWSILGYSCRHVAALADSMMVRWNSYDKQIYTFGKGQTATTITASPKVSMHETAVLLEGMIIDESAGTKNSDRVARFPHGVPAVADDCMSPWMEYVYMQQPKPTNATGVEVTISVLDPNGNCYDVGTTTSTIDGFYKLSFTPSVPGEYYVYASFEGSESYWPSNAVTAINVEEAPAATAEPTPMPTSMADIYILPGIIAIIIAIVVIGLVIILMLRKR